MSESESVKPALSAEEWAQLDFGIEYWGHASLGTKGQLNVRSADKTAIFDHEARHKLAALALHEMDFGFTRADIQTLYEASELMRGMAWPPQSIDRYIPALRDLSARIEALLPPA